jgi:hypothetical protein
LASIYRPFFFQQSENRGVELFKSVVMRVEKIWEELYFSHPILWVKLFSTQQTLSQLFSLLIISSHATYKKMADAGESAPKGGRGGFGRGRGRG